MVISDFRPLKARSAAALEHASFDHRKLILLHTGISSAVLLILAVINLILQNQIAGTVGLAGLGTRAVLETIQTILQVAVSLAMPFWEFGYFFMVLRLERGENASFSTLLGGFRCFAPMLRLMILNGLIYTVIAFTVLYPSMMIFIASPLSNAYMNALEPLVISGAAVDPTALMQDSAMVEALYAGLKPMLAVFGVLFLLIAAPVFYRLRLTQFALADHPEEGARKAIGKSFRLMKRNSLKLFKLDLSFWWFYALQAVMAVICYGDMIAPMLGITLPFSADAAYLIFYCANLIGQLLLFWYSKNYVMATYAAVYDSLDPPTQDITLNPL